MRAARILLGFAVGAGMTGAAQAGGVIMLSGATATEARVDAGLPLPDGSGLDREALARSARALGALDATVVLWFGNGARRLDELPDDQRVAYHCAAYAAEAFEAGQAVWLPAPRPLDPALWVTAEADRLLWWPQAPGPEACGAAVALLDAAPASVDFGAVELGAQQPRSVELSNLGRIELQIGALAVDGAAFSLTSDPCSGQRLLPGASCTLQLAFAPGSSAGAHAGALQVPNSGLTPSAAVPLAGVGLRPVQLIVDPTALAFGDVALGTSARRSVQLRNDGDVGLPLTLAGVSGHGYALGPDSCTGATLGNAQSCTVAVDFAPDASANFPGTLTVSRGDAGPAIQVALDGRGRTPAQPLVPSVLQFGEVAVGTTLRRSLQLLNVGQLDLVLGATSLAGSAFAIAADGCAGTTLASGLGCTVQIDFTPPGPLEASGELTFARADGGPAIQVPIEGRGATPAQPQASPTSLQFGDVAVGATLRRAVQVSNVGQIGLEFGATGVTGGPFTIASDDCAGTTLVEAQACTIEVDFAPVASAAYAFALQLARADGNPALAIALEGRGRLPGMLQVDAATLVFGEVPVGQTLRRTVQVDNAGELDLPLGSTTVAGEGYAIASDTCSGTTLAGAASCAISVDFAPAVEGAHAGTLGITPASGAPTNVALEGTGTAVSPPGDHIFGSGFEG